MVCSLGQTSNFVMNLTHYVWFKAIFQENDWCLYGNKTELKRISSHLKNRCSTKPIWYKLVCEQNMCFVTSIFVHILTLMIEVASIFS